MKVSVKLPNGKTLTGTITKESTTFYYVEGSEFREWISKQFCTITE